MKLKNTNLNETEKHQSRRSRTVYDPILFLRFSLLQRFFVSEKKSAGNSHIFGGTEPEEVGVNEGYTQIVTKKIKDREK